MSIRTQKSLKDRLLSKIGVAAPSGCWEWSGAKITGYGVIRVDRRNKLAHRASYEIHCGAIEPGLNVCHRCDNPLCINPEHLFLATHAGNMADKVAKNRQSRGEGRPLAKLTNADVLEIRAASGIPQSALAARYGIGQNIISRIRTGKRWKHVEGTA